MRSHHAFYAIASLILLGSAAEARPVNARFFLDGAAGLSIPIAGQHYPDEYYPSPKLALRLGAELWLRRRFGLAPELAVDVTPMISRPDASVHTARWRALPGLRLLFGFGRGHAFFLRFLVGVEGMWGTIAPTFETGLGLQFHVAPRTVVGFTASVPVAFYAAAADGPPVGPVQADFDLMVFVGLRL
jgi:hypothetical protein